MTKGDKKFDEFWENHKDTKPCPFCGSGNISIFRKISWKTGEPFYYLKCKFCGGSSGASADIESVYEKWQTRRQTKNKEYIEHESDK